MKKRYKKNIKVYLFLLPSLLGVSLFVFLPFADVVKRSFTTPVTQEYVGLTNYKTVLTNKAFILAMKNTGLFVITCIPLLVILSLLTAVLLYRLKNAQLLKSIFLFPMAIPAATVVLIWKMLFYNDGFVNKVIELLGGQSIAFMSSNAAFWVLVITYIWKNLGYTIILWMAGLYSISPNILEAARVDGAGEWKCFLYVILPSLKTMLYTIVILSFVNSFKVFREAYLVAGAYPHNSMYLLQHLFNNWFLNLELNKMAAAAALIALVLIILVIFLQNLWDNDGQKPEKKKRLNRRKGK